MLCRTTSSASGGPLLTSHVKATNGLGTGAAHDLIAPPPPASSVLSPASPATVASAADLQGLFLHHHHHHQQQQLHHQQFIVKREPEDLSHRHKVSGSPPPILDTSTTGSIIISGKSGGAGGAPRHKLVLVSTNGGTAATVAGDLVVDVVNNNGTTIKEEIPSHRGLNSPQHGSRSINGTPSSTSSLLGADGGGTSATGGPLELIAADGLKPPMSYSTQIFTSMNNAQHHGGSGTPSPISYSDHVPQYTTTAVSQGGGGGGYATTAATGNIRATSSTAFTVTDPYYREYFTTVTGATSAEQGYTTQVRQQIPPYADSPEGSGGGGGGGGGSGTSSTTAAIMERYGRSSVYHNNKSAVSAATVAGLTVDLPSPDSGIGAEAVTPRDQTAIQQVRILLLFVEPQNQNICLRISKVRLL